MQRIDHTKDGHVTPAKRQGGCRSGWAHAAVGGELLCAEVAACCPTGPLCRHFLPPSTANPGVLGLDANEPCRHIALTALAACMCFAAIESRLMIFKEETYDPTNPLHDLSEQQMVVSCKQQTTKRHMHADACWYCLHGGCPLPAHERARCAINLETAAAAAAGLCAQPPEVLHWLNLWQQRVGLPAGRPAC